MPRMINAELTGIVSRTATNRQVLLWNEDFQRFQPVSIFASSQDTVIPPASRTVDIPPLMSVRHYGDNPALFRLFGGQVIVQSADGNTFDSSVAQNYATYAGISGFPVCDALTFNGRHYALHTVGTTGHGVWERQNDNTWTQVQSITITASGGHRTGLFISNTGSGPVLCYLVIATTTNPATYICKTSDGTSWTNTNMGTITSTSTFNNFIPSSAIHSRGKIYVVIRNRASVNGSGIAIVVDVAAATRTAIANFTANATVCGCFATVFGRIFVHYHHTIYEYTGGSLVSRVSLPTGGSSTYLPLNASQPLLFNDGADNLIIIYPTSSAGTIATSFWRAGQIVFSDPNDTAPVFTQKDSLVPEALASGGSTSDKADGGFVAHVDNQTDPTSPDIHIWWASSLSSSIAYAKYQDADTQLIGYDIGFRNVVYTLIAGRVGGGEFISDNDSNEARFMTVTTATGTGGAGRWYVSWKFKSVDPLKTYTAKIFLSTLESITMVQATLVGTGDNCTRVGNEVNGCASETVCGVNIDATAMSLVDTSNVSLAVKLYEE